jgi:Kef-type K+ transport system membrane component KefB
LQNNLIFLIAFSILCGLLFGRLAKFVKLPNVTGYLIAGLVMGPCVLNIIPADVVSQFSVEADMALGFIAFTIGLGFKFRYFKEVGLSPVVIATCEALGAMFLIILVLILLGFDPALAILLGAIASATAPAQTIMVINQYKAKGPVTSMLLTVVALDDAVALIAFGFAATIVRVMANHAAFSILSVLQPFYEVIVSFALGGALSFAMLLLLRWFKKARNRICVIIAFVLGASWLADLISASPLLTCMALGTGLANIFDDADSVAELSETFTPPVYVLFFLMSGAGFDVKALMSVGVIGILYIVIRVAGKWGGAFLGGKLTKSGPAISRYLGPALMPQAGVAIGLITVAGKLVPEYASAIQTIILCSTFVYSIFGPSVARSALVRAKEITLPERQENLRKSLFSAKKHA